MDKNFFVGLFLISSLIIAGFWLVKYVLPVIYSQQFPVIKLIKF